SAPAAPAGLEGDRRTARVRLWADHERATLPRAALDRAPCRDQGDELRDDAPPRQRGCLPTLLGRRDLDRLVPGRARLGSRLLPLAARVEHARLSLPARHRPPEGPDALRPPRPHPTSDGHARPRRAAEARRAPRPRPGRLPRGHERIELLSIHLLEDLSSPALDALPRDRTVIILTASPLDTHGPHQPAARDACPGPPL